MAEKEDRNEPGRDSLIYQPSDVSWAVAEFVRRPPAWTARVFVYLISTFFVGGLIYTYFAKTAITVKSRGVMVTQQALFPIRGAASFKVAQLKVKDNQMVRRGDVLVVSEDQLTKRDFDIIRQGRDQLKAIIEKDKSGRCIKECIAEYRSIAENGFRLENKGEQIRDSISAVTTAVKDLLVTKSQTEDASTVLSPLYAQINEAQKKLDEIKRRKAGGLLAVQVEQLQGQIRSARATISERKSGGRSGIVSARNRVESIVNEIMNKVDLFRANQTIQAPIDGVVNNLQISGVGQLIGGGQDLMMLVPTNSILVAETEIMNKDISKIRVGQETKMKIEALPEREFGAVTGSVSEVPVNITPGQGGAEGTYKIKIELPVQSLQKDGIDYPFRLGMALEAIVIIKRESMLVLGLKKILNIKDEITGGP